VLSAGVSFTDTLLRAGTYPGRPKPPFTPGYEFVGVVEQVGSRCSTLVPGVTVSPREWFGVATPSGLCRRVLGGEGARRCGSGRACQRDFPIHDRLPAHPSRGESAACGNEFLNVRLESYGLFGLPTGER